MRKEGEEVAGAAAPRRSPPPHVECGRRHRHYTDAQVTECDDRLASRAALIAQRKLVKEQRKLDEIARREVVARWDFPWIEVAARSGGFRGER